MPASTAYRGSSAFTDVRATPARHHPQMVLIGVGLAGALLVRPRGLVGEQAVVSRHARPEG